MTDSDRIDELTRLVAEPSRLFRPSLLKASGAAAPGVD